MLEYDALMLCARRARKRSLQARLKRSTIAVWTRPCMELIQDEVMEGGYVQRLAFVAPGRMAWPLPIYELALMTAARAYDMGVELSTAIVTPEDRPMAIFGPSASESVSQLLAEAGIETICSGYAEIPSTGEIVVNPGDRRLCVDRAIALPELYGPSVRGIPLGEHGFIRVNRHGLVPDVGPVYAAGDAVDFPIKHGGLSSQQADAAAQSIAALAGAPLTPEPFQPVIRGILLDRRQAALHASTARIAGGQGFASEITDAPTWSPPSKIASRYLAPYIDEARPRGGPQRRPHRRAWRGLQRRPRRRRGRQGRRGRERRPTASRRPSRAELAGGKRLTAPMCAAPGAILGGPWHPPPPRRRRGLGRRRHRACPHRLGAQPRGARARLPEHRDRRGGGAGRGGARGARVGQLSLAAFIRVLLEHPAGAQSGRAHAVREPARVGRRRSHDALLPGRGPGGQAGARSRRAARAQSHRDPRRGRARRHGAVRGHLSSDQRRRPGRGWLGHGDVDRHGAGPGRARAHRTEQRDALARVPADARRRRRSGGAARDRARLHQAPRAARADDRAGAVRGARAAALRRALARARGGDRRGRGVAGNVRVGDRPGRRGPCDRAGDERLSAGARRPRARHRADALLSRAAHARAGLSRPARAGRDDLAERAAAVPAAPVDELCRGAALRAGKRRDPCRRSRAASARGSARP